MERPYSEGFYDRICVASPYVTPMKNNGNPMVKATLRNQDIAVLLNGLSEIYELDIIDFRDLEELHYTLANIVGDLKSQFPDIAASTGNGFHKRIDLEDLLIEKFMQWEACRHEEGKLKESANSILEFHLANLDGGSGQFVGSSNATASVASFRWALDNSRAWTRYELQLCASTDSEIEELTLGDLAHNLAIADC